MEIFTEAVRLIDEATHNTAWVVNIVVDEACKEQNTYIHKNESARAGERAGGHQANQAKNGPIIKKLQPIIAPERANTSHEKTNVGRQAEIHSTNSIIVNNHNICTAHTVQHEYMRCCVS